MDKLPPELLSDIMLHLPLADRLNCSLTCRRWAEVMTSSELLDDVWLDINKHEMGAATSVLVNSQRQYTKLLLSEADLRKIDTEFWERISTDLRELVLDRCQWPSEVFYSVLQQCTKLESLKIVDDSYSIPHYTNHFVLPEDACREELRASLSHLRHLHLDIYLTADTIDLLLDVMPNVTSIFLSGSEKESYFLERLPPVLEKNRIIRTGADFRWMESGIEDVIEFVKKTSGILEDLRIVNHEPTKSAYDALVNCTELRRLTIWDFYSSPDVSNLKRLVADSPNLEILELDGLEYLGDECIMQLSELKKLHTLCLRSSLDRSRITNVSVSRLREISTLVKLDLTVFDVDSRVMRSLGPLKKLRSLVLHECKDSETLEAICGNFEGLIELDLGDVRYLTDADGSKLNRFKELRRLSFSGGLGFSALTFESGVGSREMDFLIIDGCSLTDAGLINIASHHGRLEILSLKSCENITETGIVAMLRNEPRLKRLSVKGCKSVRREMLTDLENLCPRLRWWGIAEA